MKRFLVSILLLAATTFVTAAPRICPFNDDFYLNYATDIKITSVSYAGNITAYKKNDHQFTTACFDSQNGNSGSAQVHVVAKDGSVCDFTLVDGPYVQRPYISNFNCTGVARAMAIEDRGTYHDFNVNVY